MDFEDRLDLATLDGIAAALDLREPNREAVETIALELGDHYDMRRSAELFEGVVDVATGVGKTFIFAAALSYLAQTRGVRDFVLVAPGRVILEKTIAQFTPGTEKSIVDQLPTPITLITAENFDRPATAAAMADESLVKLYIFTVQALIKPKTKAGRRTHEFREGLGEGFYESLKAAPLLTVFADEHHLYYGDAFSAAVRDLEPWALLGLTATPHPKTPEDQVIYRYPLAAAIADRYVKTPSIVGRRDDQHSPETKLADGLELLELKRDAVARFTAAQGLPPVNPVMLVGAKDIDDAEHWAGILRNDTFLGGRYRDAVLVVHSEVPADTPEEAAELRRLADIERPGSPIRVVVYVQKLKEGWDVKNVYVLLSTRPLVSELLAEQTLGRGLRLPFGRYTDVQFLDTLEVIAHEKFEELLRKKTGLNEQFIDYKTRAVLRRDATGKAVVVRVKEEVNEPIRTPASEEMLVPGVPTMVEQQQRTSAGQEQTQALQVELAPKMGISVPRLKPVSIRSPFTLSDITDMKPYEELGRRLKADPEGALKRVLVGARVVEDESGIKTVVMLTEDAVDRVEATTRLIPLESSREELVEAVLALPVVAAREDAAGGQRRAAESIVDAMLGPLGEQAERVLSVFGSRTTRELLNLVSAEAKRFAPKPTMSDEVDVVPLSPVRTLTRPLNGDRYGSFAKASAYEGWRRGLYSAEWFDSSTERSFANLADDDGDIEWWMRLHTGELSILWTAEGQRYNADFIVRETSGDCWVVEVKMDKEATTAVVQGKREAAKRWVNRVNNSGRFQDRWHYLLATESDIKLAKGSWAALRQLGS